MIYEGKDAWYADAGGLTKIVCEQKADKAKKVMSEDECCACDEAKYNVSARCPRSDHFSSAFFAAWITFLSASLDGFTSRQAQFVFEGIWSNETHPKDYPFAVWLTHFSDIVGASHDANFSFWGENHIATDGFRSLAEW
jgi:spondin-1